MAAATPSKPLVIITGASSGIGAAAARTFSEAGHPLLLLSRRVEPMEKLALPNSLCLSLDVADAEAFAAAVKQGEDKYGPAECLINNAGTMKLAANTETQDFKEWEQMINANMHGVFNGCRAVLPGMKERRKGTIINISSTAGRKTYQRHSVYCATKFGVHAFSSTLREEVQSFGVRVVIVAPGAVETALLSQTSEDSTIEWYNQWKKGMGGPVLAPEDVARSIKFAFDQPPAVCIREICLTSTFQDA